MMDSDCVNKKAQISWNKGGGNVLFIWSIDYICLDSIPLNVELILSETLLGESKVI